MKYIYVLLSFVFLTISLSAQDIHKLTGSLLWRVSGNDLSQPSYILGTHHLIPQSFIDSIPHIHEAFNETRQVVGEVLLSDQAEMQSQIQSVSLLDSSVTYHDLLSDEDYHILDNGLKEVLGAGLDRFGTFRPAVLSMVYSIAIYSKQYPNINWAAHEPVDSYIQRLARSEDKPVIGLETIADQLYILLDIQSDQQQAQSLVCNVRNGEYKESMIDNMNKYYRNGQLDKLYEMYNADRLCSDSQDYRDAIYKDRNNKWMLRLPDLMREKPSLIAVGALHLAGDDGLLYQLAKEGYVLEAVE